MGEYDASGNVFIETVWLDGLPVGVLAGGTQFHVIPDHLGAPYAATDTSGNTVWTWNHDPFGNGAAPVYNLRFPGQYFDTETEFHYNMARTYDPTTGRYLQSDPIGLAGGVNTYAYVGGNPVNLVDPKGTQAQSFPEIRTNNEEDLFLLDLTELINSLREFGEFIHSHEQNEPLPNKYLVDIRGLPLWAQKYINYTTDEAINANNRSQVCSDKTPTRTLPFGGQEVTSSPPVKRLTYEDGKLKLE